MDPADVINPTSTRDAALARVLAYRQRVRGQAATDSRDTRYGRCGLFVVSLPMIVLLPELGIPALLVAFRLLAVEAQWAVRAYAWTDWRFTQLREWFHRQVLVTRAAILVGLFLAAVALVWLLVYEF